jgi:hypothetical protein
VRKVSRQILEEVAALQYWPHKGVLVPELEDLKLLNHRQLLAGQHRIIVEHVPPDLCYVHIVVHTARDLAGLIRRRLLPF